MTEVLTWTLPEHIAVVTHPGEARTVLLNLDTSARVLLLGTGHSIWEAIMEADDLPGVLQHLSDVAGYDLATIEKEQIRYFLSELISQGFLVSEER